MKTKLNDPASYEPVRWGTEKPWRKSDADLAAAATLEASYRAQVMRAEQGLDSLRSKAVKRGSKMEDDIKRRMMAAAGKADKLEEIGQRLKESTDTTRVGTVVWHVYRSKNKLGALVLDSARFVVGKSGTVLAY
ncbi:hypothetical protein GCM10022409_00760 [Hymenobacter glaciei]|uniref:Uncharacterized protein n=1 Tax=Hymenobacter glaciei TaxID=877209 RepID=A0ABP7T4P4_9BACT